MNIDNVEKIEDFIYWVKKISEEFGNKKHLFYRGHSDSSYTLKPSVFRKDEYNEREILLDFEHYSPRHKIQYNFVDEIDKVLVDMQHYGIPTRLLDWTLAPLNALFFACIENSEKDGEVIVLEPWKLWKCIVGEKHFKEIHKVHIISRALLARHWDFDAIKDYISKKFLYSELKVEDIKIPFPFIANYTNDRILHQRGCFTIQGICKEALDDITDIKNIIRRILIKCEFKTKIIKQLNQLYVNYYSIYPDFEGMSKMIKQKGSLFNI